MAQYIKRAAVACIAAAAVLIAGIALIYRATEPETLNWLNKPPAVFR